MKVELLYLDGCPNYEALLPALRRMLQRQGVQTEVDLCCVETQEQATRIGFLGSPTVRINGSDVEAAAAQRKDFGLGCRLYQTPGGLQGAPPEEWIISAIRDRATQG
ncbi:MAG: DF family (seleno)protein [Solirubrobacteraceae bacterium]